MAIKKIEVIGLFGKFNVAIDLSRRCNIFVGANGVGKSTTLKIVNALLSSDWIELAIYPFKCIDLILDSDLTLTISRYDLFPNIKEIRSFIDSKYDERFNEFSDDINGNLLYSEKEKCLLIIDKLTREDLFCDFLTNLQYNRQQSNTIQKIIKEKDKFHLPFGIDFEMLMIEMINHFNKKTFYNSSDIIWKVKQEQFATNIAEKTFYLDMVKFYEIDNNLVTESEYVSPLLKWMSLYPNDFYEYKPRTSLMNLYLGTRTYKMFGELINCAKDSSTNFIKEVFRNINDFRLKDDSDNLEGFFLKLISEKNLISINRLINRFYFEKQFVIDFNRRALVCYSNSVSSNNPPECSYNLNPCSMQSLNPDQIQVLEDFFSNNEVIFNITNYINPLLCEGSPFAFNVKEITDTILDISLSSNLGYWFNTAHWEFYNFYNAEIGELTNPSNVTSDVQLFKEIICEYSQIKYISIYPSGILLTEVNVEKTTRSKLTLIKNDKHAIDLNFLSSGEKKILLLTALSIFVKDVLIIIDEPELSLSLIWQEKILPDIINRTHLKKIMVATHSPYIASDESLTEYITYLPMNDGDIYG